MILKDVRLLAVEAYEIPRSYWSLLLHEMPNVAKLHISVLFALVHFPFVLRATRGLHMLSAAGYAVEGEHDTSGLQLHLLKNLNILQLHRVCLNKATDYTIGRVGPCIQDFCASLSGAGVLPLKELVLDCCYNVNEATASALRSLLDEIGCWYAFGTSLHGEIVRTSEWETLAPPNLRMHVFQIARRHMSLYSLPCKVECDVF